MTAKQCKFAWWAPVYQKFVRCNRSTEDHGQYHMHGIAWVEVGFEKTVITPSLIVGPDLFQAVVDAWNEPGVNPGYHRMMQQKLRNEWPLLAKALDRLPKKTTRRRNESR